MNIPNYIVKYRKELEFKKYGNNTIDNYISCLNKFLNYFNDRKDHEHINEQDIKTFLMQFKENNTQRCYHSSIKTFYKYVCRQPNKFKYIEYARKSNKLPIVLSISEIQSMFDVCENLKHKVILALLYSCGFRVSELINLKWGNIDRSRMIINIIQAKGKKDRQVGLSEDMIKLLEKYYAEYKSKEYVLNGQFSLQYSEKSVGEVVKQLADKANIKKRVYAHLIRHCYATHLVEAGTDINIIQRLLGHSNVKTTAIYTHISHNLISSTHNTLSNIKLNQNEKDTPIIPLFGNNDKQFSNQKRNA